MHAYAEKWLIPSFTFPLLSKHQLCQFKQHYQESQEQWTQLSLCLPTENLCVRVCVRAQSINSSKKTHNPLRQTCCEARQ